MKKIVTKKDRDELDTIIKMKFDKPVTDIKPVTSGKLSH